MGGRSLRSLPLTSVIVVARDSFVRSTGQLTSIRTRRSNCAARIISTKLICGRFSSKAPSTATCHHFVGVFCSHSASSSTGPGCLLLFNSNSFSGHRVLGSHASGGVCHLLACRTMGSISRITSCYYSSCFNILTSGSAKGLMASIVSVTINHVPICAGRRTTRIIGGVVDCVEGRSLSI